MLDSPLRDNIQLIFSTDHDPTVNLALEETLFAGLAPAHSILLVYRNWPSVICGRFQNPWLEADVDWLAAEHIPLLRRSSGGGTVWHDLGNWNFSFMESRDTFDQLDNLRWLASHLDRFGFGVNINQRGDILLNGLKISGNAMIKKQDRVLQHASLLVDADLDRLRRALRSPIPEGMAVQSRAVKSVRSSVTRLADHTSYKTGDKFFEDLLEEIERNLVQKWQPPSPEIDSAAVKSLVDRNREWAWIYGQTPEFSLTGSFLGGLGLKVRHGLVQPDEAAGSAILAGLPFPGFGALARMGFVGFNER